MFLCNWPKSFVGWCWCFSACCAAHIAGNIAYMNVISESAERTYYYPLGLGVLFWFFMFAGVNPGCAGVVHGEFAAVFLTWAEAAQLVAGICIAIQEAVIRHRFVFMLPALGLLAATTPLGILVAMQGLALAGSADHQLDADIHFLEDEDNLFRDDMEEPPEEHGPLAAIYCQQHLERRDQGVNQGLGGRASRSPPPLKHMTDSIELELMDAGPSTLKYSSTRKPIKEMIVSKASAYHENISNNLIGTLPRRNMRKTLRNTVYQTLRNQSSDSLLPAAALYDPQFKLHFSVRKSAARYIESFLITLAVVGIINMCVAAEGLDQSTSNKVYLIISLVSSFGTIIYTLEAAYSLTRLQTSSLVVSRGVCALVGISAIAIAVATRLVSVLAGKSPSLILDALQMISSAILGVLMFDSIYQFWPASDAVDP